MGLLGLVSSGLQFNGIPSALDVEGISEERLRWPSCDVASLGDALACVPNDSGLSPAVAFRVVVLGKERELRAELSENLYRIGREAIMNAYRHSGAARIEVEIEYRRGGLRIAVRDDGCGIDPHWRQNGWQSGLQWMRERSERIGARLRILSGAGVGTEVELGVPVPAGA